MQMGITVKLTRPPMLLVVAASLAMAPTATAATTAQVARGGPEARGDDGPNRIVVSAVEQGSAFAIEDRDGVTAGAGCRQDGATRAICPRIDEPMVCQGDVCSKAASAVHVAALGGDDDVRVGYGPAAAGWPQTHAFVDGGPGDDFIGGTPVVDYDLDGGAGDDLLDGAGFNDRLSGGGGRDRLYGGPGQDTLTDGDAPRAPDADVMDGGPCRDRACAPAAPAEPGDVDDAVDYRVRRAPVRVDLRSTAPVQGQHGERDVVRAVEMAVGGTGPDRLIAGHTSSRLIGNAGADTLEARNGRIGDFVNCAVGNDRATYDPGDYLVECESVCTEVDGCPRPRIVVRGMPRCIRGPFTLTVRVRGVVGFRRLVARLDNRPLAVRRRRTSRIRVPRPSRNQILDLIAVDRNGSRTVRIVEIIPCGVAERRRAT